MVVAITFDQIRFCSRELLFGFSSSYQLKAMIFRLFRRSIAAGRSFSAVTAASDKVSKTGAATKTNTSGGGRDTLGRRLLSLVFPKRSAVIAISKWKEEGNSVRKYELNRVVRELRKLRRYKHALEVSSPPPYLFFSFFFV